MSLTKEFPVPAYTFAAPEDWQEAMKAFMKVLQLNEVVIIGGHSGEEVVQIASTRPLDETVNLLAKATLELLAQKAAAQEAIGKN